MIDELINRLDQYLDRNASLEEFEDWFYNLAFDIEKRYTGRTAELVHEIEGILAEASSGHWSIAALDKYLDQAASPYREHSRVVLFRDASRRKKLRITSSPILIRKRLVL
jgi:hypothetical protein